MRVAVDCTALLAEPTGVGAFTRTLVDGLAVHADVDPVAFALTWRGRGRLAQVVPDGVDVVTRALPARPLRTAWLRTDVPRLDQLIGAHDIVHGTNFVAPPSRAASLVTVHDLTAIRFPELCTPDTLQFPALVRRAIARGAWVHTVSAHVRDEILEHFTVDPGRVRVVSNAITPSPPGDPAIGRSIAGASEYVLALGTVEPRKDLPTLVRAFDRVAAEHPDLHLVHAGPDGWATESVVEAIGSAHHSSRISLLGYVSDIDRAHLLAGASLFAYPSTYEGFGLPPLEAMTAGVPVVISDVGALVEVAGPASIQATVGDAHDLADALGRVLTDDALRADLVARGHARVAEFDPTRMIDGMVALYRDVLDR
jgi:glycosyltransferase involved in cell wall biosynthesis